MTLLQATEVDGWSVRLTPCADHLVEGQAVEPGGAIKFTVQTETFSEGVVRLLDYVEERRGRPLDNAHALRLVARQMDQKRGRVPFRA